MKIPDIIIDNDATCAFYRVINGLAIIALISLGFFFMVTRVMGLTWRNRKCYIVLKYPSVISSPHLTSKTALDRDQRLPPTYGASFMESSCTLLHHISSSFIGFTMYSVSGNIIYRRIDEGIIDDTGVVASSRSSKEINSTHLERNILQMSKTSFLLA
jgi:hypothetical protein